MTNRRRRRAAFIPLLLWCLSALWSWPVGADVVKPALVEISVFSEGRYRIEVRASIEAGAFRVLGEAMTGGNA